MRGYLLISFFRALSGQVNDRCRHLLAVSLLRRGIGRLLLTASVRAVVQLKVASVVEHFGACLAN